MNCKNCKWETEKMLRGGICKWENQAGCAWQDAHRTKPDCTGRPFDGEELAGILAMVQIQGEARKAGLYPKKLAAAIRRANEVYAPETMAAWRLQRFLAFAG